jgi:hypothetical protein
MPDVSRRPRAIAVAKAHTEQRDRVIAIFTLSAAAVIGLAIIATMAI